MSSYLLASTKPQAGWVSPALIDDRLEAEYYNPDYVALDIQLENSGLPIDALGNISKTFTGPFGSNLPSSLYRQSGIPLLRVQNIGDFGINWDNLVFLDQPTHKQLGDSRLITGDLSLAKSGSFGKIAPIWPAYGECNITEHILGIRVTDPRIDPIFLAAFLVSPYGLSQIKRKALGTILKYLGVQVSRSIKIPLPSPKTQAYIGDKVRLAEKCREEANRLHRNCMHIANERLSLGNTYQEQKGFGNFVTPSLLDDRLDVNYYAARALFALDKFREGEENGLFMMRSLEEISSHLMDFQAFSIYNSVEFSEESRVGWVEFLRVQDLEPLYVGTDKILWTSPQSHQLMPKSVVKPGDLLLTIIGTLGIAAVWSEDSHECNSNQCIAKITAKPEYDPYYLAFILNMPEMQAVIHREATGTVQKGLTLGRTRKLKVPIPDKDVMIAIGTLAKQYSKLRIQSKALIDDALKDVENLIDGKFDPRNPLSGQVESPSWMTITRALGLSSDA